MKTLKEIAGIYKTETVKAIQQGPTRAVKTGNLYSSVSNANTPQSIIKKEKGNRKGSEKISLVMNISPQAADYGKYVHNGTYKMKARPYAKVAAASPLLRKAIDDFMNERNEKELETFFEGFGKKWEQAGPEFTAS
jgi:hypothetical protein